jgi:hypothetical protein
LEQGLSARKGNATVFDERIKAHKSAGKLLGIGELLFFSRPRVGIMAINAP